MTSLFPLIANRKLELPSLMNGPCEPWGQTGAESPVRHHGHFDVAPVTFVPETSEYRGPPTDPVKSEQVPELLIDLITKCIEENTVV